MGKITRGVKSGTPTPAADANYNANGFKQNQQNAKNGTLPAGKKIKTTKAVS